MLNVPNCINPTGNCVNQMYRLSRFKENLNIQNCVNLTGNFVRYMYRLSGFIENLISTETLNV